MNKTSFWRYILAIIAFCGILVLGSIIIYFLLEITNFFLPAYLSNSSYWVYFTSFITAACFACSAINTITEESHPLFCMIICIIGAIYMLFTSISNFILGVSEFYEFASLLAAGIVCGIFAFVYGKEVFYKE